VKNKIFDTPLTTGIKRNASPDDVSKQSPVVIQDMIQNQAGTWVKRPGLGDIYPDRGTNYGYINPLEMRDINSLTRKDFINDIYDKYHNSHRRKTIVVGNSGGTEYIFAGVVKESKYESDDETFLHIYRGKRLADGVTIEWENYTFNARAYTLSTYEEGWIEYSMVMNNDSSAIYLAVSIHDTDLAAHSVNRLIALTSLYDDEFDPTWTEIEDDGDSMFASSGVENNTPDIDIDIDENNLLHIVYGIYDTGIYKFNYRKYDIALDTWTVADEIIGAVPEQFQGCSIKVYGTTVYLAYLECDNETIYYASWLTTSLPGEGRTQVSTEIWTGALALSDFYQCGPLFAIDTDGSLVFAYKKESFNVIWMLIVKSGSRSEYRAVDNCMHEWITYSVITNYDIVVKDGLVAVYYGKVLPDDEYRFRSDGRGFKYSLERKVLVFDLTDEDYTGSFFDAEVVEICTSPHRDLTTYRRYESDNLKRLTTVRWWALVIDADHTSRDYTFAYIRQDRGVIDGANEVVQKQPYRFTSRNIDEAEKITCVQCVTDESGDEGSVSYRFYERGDWQWILLPGQMDEINGQIKNETQIDDKANFWDLYQILRAGCGIEEGNEPIHYGLIDRQYYTNEAYMAYRRRNFTVEANKTFEPPVIEGGGLVPIANPFVTIEGIGYDDWQDVLAENNKYEGFGSTDNSEIGNGSVKGNPVSHGWKTFHDQIKEDDPDNYDDIFSGVLHAHLFVGLEKIKVLYMEAFIGFAFKYDNGQMSQITPQYRDDPYILGALWSSENGVLLAGTQEAIKIDLKIKRWDYPSGGSQISPRVVSIVVFIGDQTYKGQTVEDVSWYPWKDILVAKDFSDPFKDEPENGDSVWTEEADTGYMTLTDYLDYRSYERFSSFEVGNEYIGVGNYLRKSALERSYLDGYDYCVPVADRPFYLRIRMNNKKIVDAFVWAVDSTQNGLTYISPNVIDASFIKVTNFEVKNGAIFGDDNIVVIGDSDIICGNVPGDELDWNIKGTLSDNGTIASRSVIPIFEDGRVGGIAFLDRESGVRIFDLENARVVTRDINNSFVGGSNPAGTRVLTTYKGIEDLASEDCLILHLPKYRILLIHFPTEGKTIVRNFKSEDNYNGGDEYVEWNFAKNPTAWSGSPEGYLVLTDGEKLYRFPAESDDGTDAGTAFTPLIRWSNITVPPRSNAKMVWAGADYKCTGCAMNLKVIRDDGKKADILYEWAANTIQTMHQRRIGQRKKMNERFAIEVSPKTPADCTAFLIERIFGEYEEVNE